MFQSSKSLLLNTTPGMRTETGVNSKLIQKKLMSYTTSSGGYVKNPHRGKTEGDKDVFGNVLLNDFSSYGSS